MPLNPNQHADATFRRLARVKQSGPRVIPLLGPEMVAFFKGSVQNRQGKLAKIADCWGQLVPEMLSAHCALDSFSRGTLTVTVDTSSHLYELKQLLLAGLQDQLKLACASSGLKKIALKQGRWYDASTDGQRRPDFR